MFIYYLILSCLLKLTRSLPLFTEFKPLCIEWRGSTPCFLRSEGSKIISNQWESILQPQRLQGRLKAVPLRHDGLFIYAS